MFLIVLIELTVYFAFLMSILCLGAFVYQWSDHFLYSELRSIIEPAGGDIPTRSYRARHLISLAIPTFYIGRILFITNLVIQTDANGFGHSFGSQLIEYHVARHIQLATGDRKDSLFMVSMISIIACVMSHYACLYLGETPSTKRKYANLVLINMDAYREALKPEEVQARILSSRVKQIEVELYRRVKGQRWSSFISNLTFQPLASVLARWQHWTDVGGRIDMVRFAAHPLPYFPRMTLWVRLNYVRLCLALDLVTSAFIRVSFICIACAWPSVQLYFGNRVPAWSRYLQLLDSLALTYISLRLAMLASLLVCCSTIGTCLYHWSLGESVRQVTRESSNLLLLRKNDLSSYHQTVALLGTRRSIWTLLATHAHLCRVLLVTNKELWNSVLLLTVVTQLPCNGYFVHHCIAQYRSITRSDSDFWSWTLCFMVTVTVLQLAVVLAALLPLVGITKAVHRPARILPQLIDVVLFRFDYYYSFGQQHQQPKPKPQQQQLCLALKCLSLYERLTSGRKYGACLGSLKTITRRAVFQLAALYVICLLNVIKFFIER